MRFAIKKPAPIIKGAQPRSGVAARAAHGMARCTLVAEVKGLNFGWQGTQTASGIFCDPAKGLGISTT